MLAFCHLFYYEPPFLPITLCGRSLHNLSSLLCLTYLSMVLVSAPHWTTTLMTLMSTPCPLSVFSVDLLHHVILSEGPSSNGYFTCLLLLSQNSWFPCLTQCMFISSKLTWLASQSFIFLFILWYHHLVSCGFGHISMSSVASVVHFISICIRSIFQHCSIILSAECKRLVEGTDLDWTDFQIYEL